MFRVNFLKDGKAGPRKDHLEGDYINDDAAQFDFHRHGVNGILKTGTKKSIQWIFGEEKGEMSDIKSPNWMEILERAEQAYDDLKKYLKDTPFLVQPMYLHSEDEAKSPEDALKKFMDRQNVVENFRDETGAYFNKNPIKVEGIVLGHLTLDPPVFDCTAFFIIRDEKAIQGALDYIQKLVERLDSIVRDGKSKYSMICARV